MSASSSLTLAFAAFLLAGLAVKFWLASRQIRHVARHREAVPPAFTEKISLAAHQKAADYKPNKFFTPVYLMKLAAAHEADKNNTAAIEAYNQIIDKYFDSSEVTNAKKYKSKLEGLANN